jgi:Tol biopolymer transport system component
MRPLLTLRHLTVLFAFGMCALPTERIVAQATVTTDGWDVTHPRGRTRTIDFTTSEGTWTSVDVAPDGTWLAFDVLGHIYRIPIGGGTAECLTQSSGIAMNVQPRISPDGRSITFISDRQGQMNVWTMDSDGKKSASRVPRQP